MGLDLYLLPIESDANDWGYSHSVISCHRDGELFDAIMGIEKVDAGPVPLRFSTFVGKAANGETGYGDTQKTPYGEAVRAVRVGALLKLFDQAREYNVAAWSYLERLPPTMRVALYWH